MPEVQDHRFCVKKLINNEQFSQAIEQKILRKNSSIDSVFKMCSLGEPVESILRRVKGASCEVFLRANDGQENSLADSNNAGKQSEGC